MAPQKLVFSRRDWLQTTAVGVTGFSASGWLDVLAARAAETPGRPRPKACIVLWMSGGLSQIDTFDMKPDSPDNYRGPFRPSPTAIPGVQFCELLPRLARQINDLAVLRSMSTANADHGAGVKLMHHAGLFPMPIVKKPSLGATISAALGDPNFGMPTHVVIGRQLFDSQCGNAGFLGAKHDGMIVTDPAAGLDCLSPTVAPDLFQERLQLFQEMEQGFAQRHRLNVVDTRRIGYENAVNFMRSPKARAFNLDLESATLRDNYGRNQFGAGCLLARRLVEIGVPFVEVKWNLALSRRNIFGPLLAWDTHTDLEESPRNGLPILDAGMATLISDLKARGLLESTLVVCMGEFGRTPKVGNKGGRDHFGRAWTVVLAGGGVRGGIVLGRTSPNGEEVEDRPIQAAELLATICTVVGLDPNAEFGSRDGQLTTVQRDAQQAMRMGLPVRLFASDQPVIREIL